MEITRTEVTTATGSSGQQVLRVRFCGEGGDCVTVDMAAVDHSGDDAALTRAKAILIQTATFDSSLNEYDARSNGNFDELQMVSAEAAGTGVYVFEYRDGEAERRTPPVKLPSVDAAREEAMRSAIDLLVDLQPGKDDLMGWLVRVYAENGDLVCTVDVQGAELARKERPN